MDKDKSGPEGNGNTPAFGGASDQVFIDISGNNPPQKIEVRFPGLTKREKFAETALLGILSSGQDHIDGQGDVERHSRLAVQYADGLLKELEKNG